MRKLPVAAALFAVAACAANRSAVSERATETSNTIFFDDFDGAALDRAKWNVEVTGRTVNDEQQAYVDAADALYLVRGSAAEGAANGALVIHARFRPGYATPEGRTFDFVSGRINTRGKFEFAYGTVSARMKLPAGSGLWPAFWVLGTGDWPDTGEIDIMEYVGDPQWVSAALHGPGYSGDTPLVNRLYFRTTEGATTWHVYSVEWGPQGFVFNVDDDVMYIVTRPMIEHYGRWAFDNPKFLILNFALGGAYPFKTNGVETPYRGMTESAVELIRSDRARVLIDWVRVTSN